MNASKSNIQVRGYKRGYRKAVKGTIAVIGFSATMMAIHANLATAKQDNDFGVETISTRADRVSGGDVLVKVTYKHDNRNHPLQITLNGHDVSGAFHPGADPNTLIGLVTGLVNGKNALRVQGNGSSGIKDETLEITNYPIKGPIVSGLYVQPFICQTSTFRLPDGTTLGAPPTPIARRRQRSHMSTCRPREGR